YAGSPETAAQAAAAGADVVIVASSEPTPYKLIVQPGIKSIAALKGKRIGTDRFGGSSYYATRRMLEKLGLRPEEVEFMQVTGGGNQRVAAFRSGILSGVVSTVERFERSAVPITCWRTPSKWELGASGARTSPLVFFAIKIVTRFSGSSRR